MIYTLKRHPIDSDMVEAITDIGVSKRNPTWLAFIIHVDMLERNLLERIDAEGSIDVYFSVTEE